MEESILNLLKTYIDEKGYYNIYYALGDNKISESNNCLFSLYKDELAKWTIRVSVNNGVLKETTYDSLESASINFLRICLNGYVEANILKEYLSDLEKIDPRLNYIQLYKLTEDENIMFEMIKEILDNHSLYTDDLSLTNTRYGKEYGINLYKLSDNLWGVCNSEYGVVLDNKIHDDIILAAVDVYGRLIESKDEYLKATKEVLNTITSERIRARKNNN